MLNESGYHGFMLDIFTPVVRTRPACVKDDPGSLSFDRGDPVQRCVRFQKVGLAGGVVVRPNRVVNDIIFNLWVVLVPSRVRDAL